MTTSKEKYDVCKTDTFGQINHLRKFALLFLFVMLVLFAVILIDLLLLFKIKSSITNNVALLQLIIVIISDQKNSQALKITQPVLIPLTGILMTLSAVPFFAYQYLTNNTSVDAALKVSKIFRTTLILWSIGIFASTSLALVFLGLANASIPVVVVAVVIRSIWAASLIGFYYLLSRRAATCHVAILAFHDFLITYK